MLRIIKRQMQKVSTIDKFQIKSGAFQIPYNQSSNATASNLCIEILSKF